MRQMWLGIKFFCGKPSSVGKKKRKFGQLSTEEIQEITDNVIPVTTKKPIKFGMRIINGMYPFKFLQNSNMNIAILLIHKDYVTTTTTTTTTIFTYLNFFNVTEWLASPGGTKKNRQKKCQKKN